MSLHAHLWMAMAMIPVAALVMYGMAFASGPRDRQLELGAYISILAFGLALYYVGRAHFEVLAVITWPFLLIAIFILDRAWTEVLGKGRASRSVGKLLLAAVMGISIDAVLARMPLAVTLAKGHWVDARVGNTANTGPRDLSFIKAHTHPGERVGILAPDQAPLFADSGLRSAIGNMGYMETQRKIDAQVQIDQILHPDFDQLFVSYGLCCGAKQYDLTGWVPKLMPGIQQTYALLDWSEDGALMRLTPKKLLQGRPNLFDFNNQMPPDEHGAIQDPRSGLPVTTWRQPVTFPHVWPYSVGTTFHVHLRFSIERDQPPFATILSNHESGIEGVNIEMDQPGFWTLHVGMGDNYAMSAPFAVAPGVDHDLDLSVDQGRVVLIFDGKTLFDDPSSKMAPSNGKLVTGGFFVPGREMQGRLLLCQITGTVYPR